LNIGTLIFFIWTGRELPYGQGENCLSPLNGNHNLSRAGIEIAARYSFSSAKIR